MATDHVKSEKLFVGIGSGAIQLGLWGYYAFLEGAEIVLSEVDAPKVASIRANHQRYSVNIAHFDKIVPVTVGPVHIYNPMVPSDRSKLLGALARANDVVTAVPSTALYAQGGIAQLLREGLRDHKTPVMIYASENQVGAARMLEQMVYEGEKKPDHVQFSETVIERMGGAHTDEAFIQKLRLEYVTPSLKQALLVEEFDKIVGERNEIPARYGFSTLFDRFVPTRDIHLYEELKLLGHNAVHFMLGCLGKLKGYTYMSDYNGDADYQAIGYHALLDETGGWFKPRYRRSGEPVATEAGFEQWADQLTRRIANPFLYDAVERVIRDPGRKLGWNDRMTWTMREALAAGIEPRRYALGVAAALLMYVPGQSAESPLVYCDSMSRETALDHLDTIWGTEAEPAMRERLLSLVGTAVDVIHMWKQSGEPSLYPFLLQKEYLSKNEKL
jgi:mannitol-1-phosphate 5-dehydrogenase